MVHNAATTGWRRGIFLLVGAIVPAAVLALLVLIAVSPVPMRGAEVFGMIANKIKGHPRATAYWTLFAGSMLWLVIGLLAATENWRSRRSIEQTEAARNGPGTSH